MKKIRLYLFYWLAFFSLYACGKEKKAEVNSIESILGSWEGPIQAPETPLPIIIQFAQDENTISITIQGLNNYPLTSVEFIKC